MPLSTRLLTIAAAAAITAGCQSEPIETSTAPPVAAKPKAKAEPSPTPKAKPVTPPGDPHAIAKANDAKPPPLPIDASVGTFDFTVDGKVMHMLRLPRGQNRATAIADKGIARVSVAAAQSHTAWPHVRINIENLRLDRIEYPLTLPSNAKDAKRVGVTVRYQVGEQRNYITDKSKGATVRLTLDSFVGKTLSGSFEGSLAPTAAGLGAPIPVSGKFSVELGLRGVEPGPASDAKAPAATP